MKVVGIVGSGRPGGNTEILTSIALEEIRKEGLKTELISLAGKKIEPCNGCRACVKTGKCHFKDDFDFVFAKMKAADGIILATPVYFGAATPQMTSLISRFAKNETIQEEGKYLLAGTSHSEAPPFSGDGNILRIAFDVTHEGSCRLDVEAKLADWPPPDRDPRISLPILHETIDGFYGREIKISIFPMVVFINESVNINGFIIPPLANVEVPIQYRYEGEPDWRLLSTVITNEQGGYHFIWRPQNCGRYEIRAEALLLGAEETSSTVFVTVKSPDKLMWMYIYVLVVVTVGLVVTVFIFRRRVKRQLKQFARSHKLKINR